MYPAKVALEQPQIIPASQTWIPHPGAGRGPASPREGLTVVARGPMDRKRHRAGFGSRERYAAFRAGKHTCWFRSWQPPPMLNLSGGDQMRPALAHVQEPTCAGGPCTAGRTFRAVAQLPSAPGESPGSGRPAHAP